MSNLLSDPYFESANKLWNNRKGSRAKRKARREKAKRIIKGLLVPCTHMDISEMTTFTDHSLKYGKMQFLVRCVGYVWKGQVYCYKGYDHEDLCLAAVVL